jgi:hypothetical protein
VGVEVLVGVGVAVALEPPPPPGLVGELLHAKCIDKSKPTKSKVAAVNLFIRLLLKNILVLKN